MNFSILKTAFALCIVPFLSAYSLEVDDGSFWPKEIKADGGTIIIYQPEIESLQQDKMESRSAVSVTTKDNPTPVFGAMWYNCKIATDRDERTVILLGLDVEAANFPDMDENDVEQVKAFIEKEVPKWELVMSLDDILTSLDYEDISVNESENYNNEAPEILFKTTPTALVLIDGNPVLEEIENSDYNYVINTPFFIVEDNKSSKYYLMGGDYWYVSDQPDGGFKETSFVPAKIIELGRENQETLNEEAEIDKSQTPPEILVRKHPAELLQSNGNPQYSPIKNTSLLYMSNTDDDIIMDINSQEYYVLISGRWYKSKELNSGKWQYIPPDQLPEDFANIPGDSPISNVRASVKGTKEAKEAVLETQIPQTAEIDRNSASIDVEYDGYPEFEDIEGTRMRYAVNTDKSVLLIDGRYYCCDNAIWFEGPSPSGPWAVSIEVPTTVQDIPPRYPVYNVKYVYIYDYNPSVVYVGYTPGYVHSYVYRGCVYYGTGYYYRPWHRQYYYSRPVTYGYRVHYDPYNGWRFAYGATYHGYRWVRHSYDYHSQYHGYWGPGGYKYGYHYANDYRYHDTYNRAYHRGYYQGQQAARRQSNYTNTRTTNNVYVYRPNGVSRTGNSSYNPRTGERVTVNQTSTRRAPSSTSRNNNVYTDRTGNVYRRTSNGNWEQRNNGSWVADSRRQPTSRGTDNYSNNRQNQQTTGRQNQQNTNRQYQNRGQNQQNTRNRTPYNRQNQQTTGRENQQNTKPSQTQRQQQPNGNLDRQYNSRTRSTERTQNYNQNRSQNQSQQSKNKSNSGQTRTNQSRSSNQNKKSTDNRSSNSRSRSTR